MIRRTSQIRILFYCDDYDATWVPIDADSQTLTKPNFDEKGNLSGTLINDKDTSAHRYGKHEFGLGILKTILENYDYAGNSHKDVKISVDVVNRNYTYNKHGDIGGCVAITKKPLSNEYDFSGLNYITPELLKSYSQIWIFGRNYGDNIDIGPSLRVNESLFGRVDWTKHNRQTLTADELATLETWMDAGNGVLITGDHSNSVSDSSGVTKYYNLGRALGKDIVRASEMRVWEEGPTAYPPNNVDTTHSGRGIGDSFYDQRMNWMAFQEDSIP
jgi:hypothetical protein